MEMWKSDGSGSLRRRKAVIIGGWMGRGHVDRAQVWAENGTYLTLTLFVEYLPYSLPYGVSSNPFEENLA